jgi:hypothetical protein
MKRAFAYLTLLVGVVSSAACTLEKTEHPLSPSVAGPIPGVNITAPILLEPLPAAAIAADRQPIVLLIENAGTNGQRPLSYLFEIATDIDFTNTVIAQGAIPPGTGGRTSLRLNDTLASDRSYYWRAKAQDGANEGPYSATRFFRIFTPIVIDRPVLLAPINNVVVSNLAPTFTIGNAPRSGPVGSIGYEIELASNDSFSNKLAIWIVGEQPNQTKLTAPSGLPGDLQIFWHARAFDPATFGPWSSTAVFRTPAPPPGGGGGGSPCGPPYPSNGEAVVQCVQSRYPHLLLPVPTLEERMANMAFLRDRVIETGICGGMDLGWNRKQSGALSIDAIAWRHDGIVNVVDIGFQYDTPQFPFYLQWIVVGGVPGYVTYSPRPSC